ncbi:MAG: hypothetical protein ACREJ0_26995 [Geminicoccaceae bacterium]
MLVALALAVVTGMVGRELVSIQSLAADVQSAVLPQIMTRHQRAIWIESLRSAADVVLYAPDRTTRHQALAKAEQLAASATHADAPSRAALDDAWTSIRLAASKTDEAQRIDQQMQAMLNEADGLITDMSANLSSIVDDSGATIARMVKEAVGAHAQSPYSRQLMEEALAINTTSHELLASLDHGRIILGSALSLENDDKLASAETHFVAIGRQLQARVDTLRGNSDYEYLPDMIQRFRRLNALFDHQRSKLDLLQEAMAASASAKLRLGVVRETLAADAAAAAEASVGNIAASASRIKLTAAAMVVILILAAAVPLTRNWQGGRAGGPVAASASPQDGVPGHVLPAGTVGATVASLESLIKAQGNLEHWRHTLSAKLTGAVSGALLQVAGHPQAAADHPRPDEQAASAHRDMVEAAVLPPELSPCLTRVVGLIEDVAAQTSLVGLRASLHGVRLVGGATPAPDQGTDAPHAASHQPFAPSEVLAAAAAAADAVTERVGTTISEVNALAQRADRDLTQATADIVQMIAQLADQLVAIRDGDWRRPSYVG